MANRISSATTVSPSSVVTRTGPSPPSSRSTAATDLPNRTSTPASRSASVTISPANGSIRPSSPPRTSIVTVDPSARNAVAISTATTPPPTTASRSGTCRAAVACRLVHGRTSASPGRSGNAVTVPVHTPTACRAVSFTRSPAGVSTATWRGPFSRPCPRTRSTETDSSHSSWSASCQCAAIASRCSNTAGTSSGPSTARRRPGTRRASARASTGRSSALLGSHAQNEHSPPSSSFSTITVLSPAALVRSARFSPSVPLREPPRRRPRECRSCPPPCTRMVDWAASFQCPPPATTSPGVRRRLRPPQRRRRVSGRHQLLAAVDVVRRSRHGLVDHEVQDHRGHVVRADDPPYRERRAQSLAAFLEPVAEERRGQGCRRSRARRG